MLNEYRMGIVKGAGQAFLTSQDKTGDIRTERNKKIQKVPTSDSSDPQIFDLRK